MEMKNSKRKKSVALELQEIAIGILDKLTPEQKVLLDECNRKPPTEKRYNEKTRSIWDTIWQNHLKSINIWLF